MEDIYINNIKFKGEPCVKMSAGRYSCVIAPGIGSNILRLYDKENLIELVNFNMRIPMKWIRHPSILCGMPSMLFPNRIANGILKTSDNEYHFPINENKFNNYIHGFIHARQHKLIRCEADTEHREARTITEYVYDKNDPFYKYFPVNFTVRFIFTLGLNGLHYEVAVTNNSDKMLPLGLGNHTSIRAPFVKRGKKKNIRLTIPAVSRLELDERNLCTGNFMELNEHDKLYITGDMIPVLQDIDNEMYLIDYTTTADGRKFHGIKMTDIRSGKSIIYEVSQFYKYFIVWNCGGECPFFCPEPISWMINAPNINLPDEITGYKELSPGTSFTAWQHLSSET